MFDLGIPRMTKVDREWTVCRLKSVTENLDSYRIPLEATVRGRMANRNYEYYGASGVIDRVESYLFDEPLVLIAEDGANLILRNLPLVFMARGKFWVNNHAHVLRPTGVDGLFLVHLLQSMDFAPFITGAAQPKLTAERLMNITVCLPDRCEQQAIVKYLGNAHARIDDVIAKKRQLVALLGQQKQAIINQAVTRGLDPSAELKHSGIPWLGLIPAHWRVVRAKVLFADVDCRSRDGSEELLSVSHITGVTPRAEKNATMFLAETNVGYKVCRPGDLVFNTMWVWMGALGVSHYDGIVSPAYNVYRPTRPDVDACYFSALFRTPSYVAAFASLSTGVTPSRLRFYPADLAAMPTVLPPLDEQQAIVAYIDCATASINRAVQRTQREIDLLAEFRVRLTSDVVTGQVDVRQVAATLPDLTEDELSVPDGTMVEEPGPEDGKDS